MASLYRACGGCHRVKPAAGQVGIAIQCVLLAALAWSASATAQSPVGVPAAAPASAEINARSAAESNRILNLIQDTAIEYARAQGYDLVVPSPVVYANPRIDITDAVLQRLKTLGAGTAKP